MECKACGYTTELNNADVEQNPEPFYCIDGKFVASQGRLWDREQTITLYACPKCGTVKMDK